MAGEAPGQTLQPTALVHEAWLRLTGAESKTWDSRGHFFAAAAEAMRRILIERARAKSRLRRGGGGERIPLDHVTVASDDPPETVLAIHEALEKLAARDPFKAEVVKMRYFVGLSQDEIARALGLAMTTQIAALSRKASRAARASPFRRCSDFHHPTSPPPGRAAARGSVRAGERRRPARRWASIRIAWRL